jgi:hypothetical protein
VHTAATLEAEHPEAPAEMVAGQKTKKPHMQGVHAFRFGFTPSRANSSANSTMGGGDGFTPHPLGGSTGSFTIVGAGEARRPCSTQSKDFQHVVAPLLRGRLGARRAAAVPAAPTESPFFGEIGLDLPAKPDRPTAKVRNRLREVHVPAATEREGSPPDAGKLGGLGKLDKVERKNSRSLFCRFGSYRAPFWLVCAHRQLMQ